MLVYQTAIGLAVATASYIRNRSPTSALTEDVTPYQRWYGRKPSLEHLKVFGCIAYAHVPDVQRQKLDKKARKFRFIGYSIQSKGYRLLDESTRKVFVRRDVVFNESDFGEKMIFNDEMVEALEVSYGQDRNLEVTTNLREGQPQQEIEQAMEQQAKEQVIRR